jgi:hypothetical protein
LPLSIAREPQDARTWQAVLHLRVDHRLLVDHRLRLAAATQ